MHFGGPWPGQDGIADNNKDKVNNNKVELTRG
jgi:hypothetical protein